MAKDSENFSLRNKETQTANDQEFKSEMEAHFEKSAGTSIDKLNNFTRFVSRQTLSIFLAKHDLFRQILNVHGAIVECGVFMGGGTFTWAQCSAIYEPVNHGRKIIGFDTFSGFPGLSAQDFKKDINKEEHKDSQSYSFEALDELEISAGLFDLNRPVGHISKIEFVKGDALETIPEYVEENKHLVIALLYLDFDLYEPTRAALKHFVPRMPKGAILAFDELNQKQWPGETMAVLEEVGIRKLHIQRFPFTPGLSYAVLD